MQERWILIMMSCSSRLWLDDSGQVREVDISISTCSPIPRLDHEIIPSPASWIPGQRSCLRLAEFARHKKTTDHWSILRLASFSTTAPMLGLFSGFPSQHSLSTCQTTSVPGGAGFGYTGLTPLMMRPTTLKSLRIPGYGCNPVQIYHNSY